MENFNALLTLSELKTLYANKPVGICPLYKGSIGGTKRNEAAGNPVTIPKYEQLEKLAIEFSPKQAGTGDPSPENVRPITGWDSVKVTVSDKEESHGYDVTLPETIYGGTVDAVNGVGSKEWSPAVDLETSSTPSYIETLSNETTCLFGAAGLLNMEKEKISLCCSHLAVANILNASSTNIGISGNPWGNMVYIRLPRTTASNLSEFVEWLEEQKTAGTPVQVAYNLATPTPFELSKISIPSLGSENTIFTSGENMDIIYRVSSFWG